MSGHHQQTTIYTIQDSQLNNGGGGGGSAGGSGLQRNSNADLLIDTSGVPMGQQQQVMSAMQHAHHPLQPQPVQPQAFDSTITSQPVNGSSSAAGAAAASARVAPESQNVVYSVHPVFGMLDNHDTLLIRQKADCTSTCCGFESDNTYTVRDKEGTPVLKAIESEYRRWTSSSALFVAVWPSRQKAAGGRVRARPLSLFGNTSCAYLTRARYARGRGVFGGGAQSAAAVYTVRPGRSHQQTASVILSSTLVDSTLTLCS